MLMSAPQAIFCRLYVSFHDFYLDFDDFWMQSEHQTSLFVKNLHFCEKIPTRVIKTHCCELIEISHLSRCIYSMYFSCNFIHHRDPVIHFYRHCLLWEQYASLLLLSVSNVALPSLKQSDNFKNSISMVRCCRIASLWVLKYPRYQLVSM